MLCECSHLILLNVKQAVTQRPMFSLLLHCLPEECEEGDFTVFLVFQTYRSGVQRPAPPYLLPFLHTVLDPLEIDATVAGAGDPLETRHVVVVNVSGERGKVTLDIMPLGERLQGLQQ